MGTEESAFTECDGCRRQRWHSYVLYATVVIVTLLVGLKIQHDSAAARHNLAHESEARSARLAREAADRANQDCVIFENQKKANINRLSNTYSFLEALSPEQLALAKNGKGASLNVLVLRNLKQTEADAKVNPAPAYCSKAGVGAFDDPGRGARRAPVIPTRPEGF